MANDVTFQRDEYKKSVNAWRLVGDCCEGQEAMRRGREAYLPRPNPLDKSSEAKQRYEDYLSRAIFYNATGRTLDGMVGLAFAKQPELSRHAEMEYIEDDIDGRGLSIYQQSQEALEGVMQADFYGLLVDYPKTDGAISKAQAKKLSIRPTVAAYPAESITNWRSERVGGAFKLSLVVLKESDATVTDDGFGVESKPQYRALKLIGGVYVVEIWKQRQVENKKELEWYIADTFTPRKANGSLWQEIPFSFVGAKNNDAKPGKAPLYDIAAVNVGHWRNSAEYEDTSFMCGQIQPTMIGIDQEWVKFLKSEGFQIGSRTMLPLPDGAQFLYVQAQPNVIPAEAMEKKERQMVALGAQLITQTEQAKTATEAGNDNARNTSVLALACSNVSEAYTKCLYWMSEFLGVAHEFAYKINQDFNSYHLEPNLVTALVQLWQTGRYPDSDLWALLKKYGLINPEKQDEEIKEELEASGNGLGLDDQGSGIEE